AVHRRRLGHDAHETNAPGIGIARGAVAKEPSMALRHEGASGKPEVVVPERDDHWLLVGVDAVRVVAELELPAADLDRRLPRGGGAPVDAPRRRTDVELPVVDRRGTRRDLRGGAPGSEESEQRDGDEHAHDTSIPRTRRSGKHGVLKVAGAHAMRSQDDATLPARVRAARDAGAPRRGRRPHVVCAYLPALPP